MQTSTASFHPKKKKRDWPRTHSVIWIMSLVIKKPEFPVSSLWWDGNYRGRWNPAPIILYTPKHKTDTDFFLIFFGGNKLQREGSMLKTFKQKNVLIFSKVVYEGIHCYSKVLSVICHAACSLFIYGILYYSNVTLSWIYLQYWSKIQAYCLKKRFFDKKKIWNTLAWINASRFVYGNTS